MRRPCKTEEVRAARIGGSKNPIKFPFETSQIQGIYLIGFFLFKVNNIISDCEAEERKK